MIYFLAYIHPILIKFFPPAQNSTIFFHFFYIYLYIQQVNFSFLQYWRFISLFAGTIVSFWIEKIFLILYKYFYAVSLSLFFSIRRLLFRNFFSVHEFENIQGCHKFGKMKLAREINVKEFYQKYWKHNKILEVLRKIWFLVLMEEHFPKVWITMHEF